MNQKSASSLPSLAHPVIVSPAEEVEEDKEPLLKPPFPGIDLNWPGFTLSHLHLVGINTTYRERWRSSEDEHLRPRLAISHELAHRELSLTPFSMIIKNELFVLYDLILTTFEKEQGQINVPVTADEAGNALQKKWDFIVRLMRRSELVEEVYAIRSSLLAAQEYGLLSHGYMQDLINKYKKVYGKTIHEFSAAYDAFDLIARKIGEDAATCLIHHLLETGYPNSAFSDHILEMCEIENRDSTTTVLWALSDGTTDFMSNLSCEQAYHYFIKRTGALDPDDSKYKRKVILEFGELIKKEWSRLSQGTEDDFAKFIYGSPTTVLFSEYSDDIHRFPKLISSKLSRTLREVDYGNFFILLEAILQQLTKGIGLLCPFWSSSHGCCSRSNQALLEKAWSCTKPDSSCDWERMGCLAKRIYAKGQRKRLKTSVAKA